MKQKKSHAFGAFAMAAVLTAQLLSAPLTGVFAAEETTDSTLAYFVDCGDFDVSTLSEGDKFGIYNTVTEQAYGEDPGTGKKWGIVDSVSNPLKNGTAPSAPKAAYTDNTWPNEWVTGDGVDKTQSNRYTKNQIENGMPRVLDYSFELPNGNYTVELFFVDPWGVSIAPTATFEETITEKDILIQTETSTSVTVTDGSLDIHITSESACINLAYIKIYLPGTSTGTNKETNNKNTGETTMTDFTTYAAYSLNQVDVTDAYLTNAEAKDIEYLLSLDADRLLAGFRETAGVDMRGKKRYAGWENMLIGGHTMGHYLTAVAQAVATLPSDDARDKELADRLDYIIDSLKECQDALGTGFLFGATISDKNNIELQFDHVENNKTNIITEAWVPWYTMHKILAGIIDVYKYTGNETALDVAKGLGDWVYNRTQSWSAATHRTVLSIEYGGMNDCLYELYAVSGEDKYAVAAHAFDEDTLFEAVKTGRTDVLTNRHANTTIPKFIGALNRYMTTHGKTINGEVVDASAYLEYAQIFFDMVLERHTYITGDNSEWEHFGSDYILDAERTNCNCETCNAYNMLKFAKALYMSTGDTKYLNYYENTFYNTILSSQNPESGMTTYFQPMATGYFKTYTTATGSFWCCTGSGMENFTKLGNAIYYSGDDRIVISQYLSSVLMDEAKNVKLSMTADIPSSEKVTVTVNTLDGSTEVTNSIAFRLPEWLAGEAAVTVTGNPDAVVELTEEYAIVSSLTNGDTIELTLPMNITVHGLPDNDSVFAFKYGPIVLSAKLGTTDMTTTYTGVSVLIPAAKLIEEEYISDGNDTISVINGSVADFMANINENLTKTAGKLEWVLQNTDANLTFVPHYSQHTERYGIYFNYESNSDAFNVSRYLRELEDNRFAAALLDTVQPGYGQYENDELHNMTELGNGSTGATGNGTSRLANAGGGFVYTMYADPDCDNALELTLKKEDNGKSLQILVGEEIIYNEVLAYNGTEEEYTIRIPVSKDILAKTSTALGKKHPTTGKDAYTINITFQSGNEDASARICNYAYMTKAYAANTGFTLSADAGELTQDGTSYKLVLPEEVETLTLTATPEDEFGYLRVNGSVVRDTYTIDMTVSNFLTLEYTVYGEDHETTATYTVNIEQPVTNRTDVDPTLAYFVNCGDYDVTTLSEGDLFGIYNGVTEQIYGIDPVTGKKWGIVDTVSTPLRNGTANNPGMTNTVFTDNTWTFETNSALSDSSPKTATNRYTKNQYENGIARNLNYSFELPNGKYTVELYFTDPWNCSKNPIVSLEGFQVLKNVSMNKAVTAEVLVKDGELNLAITSPSATLCLNLCYIKIYLPEDAVVTPTPEPTATPIPTEAPEPTVAPTEAPVEPTSEPTAPAEDNTDTDASTDAKSVSALPWVAGGAVVIGAVVGALAYFFKKKKK